MRTLASSIQTLLASGQNVEPVAIIGVLWNDQGSEIIYADRDIIDPNNPANVLAPGRILEMGHFDDAQKSDSSGSSGSVSVVLDDRDGSLKSIFDAMDIHKRKVNVYQSFMDLDDPVGDKFLIFSGQISTPLVWDEGKRTLSFDIVTKLEDFEVGWSAEMGNYPQVAVELIGKAWPMPFGTVQHSPCLRLQNIPTAFTTDPFGVNDTQVGAQIAALEVLLGEAIFATLGASQQVADDGGDTEDIMDDPTVKKFVAMQATIQDEIQELQATEAWQGIWLRGSVGLIPTVYVSQPYSGLFRVGNNLFNGTLNGVSGTLECQPQMLPGAPAAQNVREGFQFYNSGTQAVISGPYPLKYVASVTPGTVQKVWAMRSFNGLKQMAAVPPSYYTISTETIGSGMTATFVTLNEPLSTIAMVDNQKTQIWENAFGKYLPSHIVNQIDWDDDLYVSFTSDVGPNPVDIMEWIITNFSGNSYDSTSFSAVRTKVAPFPMNFTLSETRGVTELLAEIAYQAQCVIYLRDDVFYLLYLPAGGASVHTLTEADVMVDSLQVTTTSTEELVTKYRATYRPDYSPFFSEPVNILLRYNIPKYGVHEQQHDFYCYNSFDAVHAAATYWLIQKSQTWKILKARLLLTRLDLEVFDYVTLGFVTPYVSTDNAVGLITRCVYDSDEKYIDVEIWCPVLLGTMTTSNFGFPAGATEVDEWPQYHNLAGGGASGLSSPQLPPSNPRSEPAGVINVGFGGGDLSQPIDFGNYQSGLGFTPPLADAMPRAYLFPETPLPTADPTQDYSFQTPPDPTVPTQTGTFPALIHDKVGPSQQFPDIITYNVDVYENGLINPPMKRVVGQLQIDKDDTIPPETWTEVTVNQGTNSDGTVYYERTMQIPVWLE